MNCCYYYFVFDFNCLISRFIDNLLSINNHSKYKMTNRTTNSSQSKPVSIVSSDSEEEEIMIKNLQTGSTENSKALMKDHSSLLINNDLHDSVWSDYFKSIKKIQDKLLQLVVRKNKDELLKLLMQFPLELSQFRYMNGWTLLHFSVSQNDTEITELLLKFGLDVDLHSEQMQRTALHEAALANKAQITKILILWGANPNLVDTDRNTPIHFAVDYGYVQIVKIILSSKISVDLDIRNCINMTTFNTCRKPQIFELLINYNQKNQKPFSHQSRQTATSNPQQNGQIYESRLRIRNSDVIPNISRVDQVQKFLSLREAPTERKKSNKDSDSIISQQSYEQNLNQDEPKMKLKKKNTNLQKSKRRVGSYLRNNSILKSCRIASQNIGLVRETIFQTYLDNQQLIQNYDKVKKLGSGAFAEVFLVRKKRSSTIFAMKKIDKKLIIENDLQKYIRAEKYVLTEVDHPFVIKGHFFLQNFTHLFILMDLCEGGDLEKYVRKTPLSEEIAKTYACEAALALDQLQKKNILYRDMKVSNMLIDKFGHLKLSDFGLAKKAVSSDSFVGSVSYLAPQMLVEGEKKPHNKSLDWYLLGIFIYELLHGLPPFYDEDKWVMEENIRNQKPKYNNNISAACKEVIDKLLQKNPEKRLNNLVELKKLQWFNTVNWQKILNKQGQVMKIEKVNLKQLLKKEYFEDESQDKLINEKIEWFDNWNYPKKQES